MQRLGSQVRSQIVPVVRWRLTCKKPYFVWWVPLGYHQGLFDVIVSEQVWLLSALVYISLHSTSAQEGTPPPGMQNFSWGNSSTPEPGICVSFHQEWSDVCPGFPPIHYDICMPDYMTSEAIHFAGMEALLFIK
jgi:hypothetical protein